MTPRLCRRVSVAGLAVLSVLAGVVANPAGAVAADDDDLRISVVSPNNVICWEKPNPDDPCRVDVRLSHRVRVAVAVSFVTADGTAVAREDYRAVADRLTIPAGDLSAEVVLWVEDDGAREPDEWFYATLSEPSVGRVEIGRAAVTIRDGSPPAGR